VGIDRPLGWARPIGCAAENQISTCSAIAEVLPGNTKIKSLNLGTAAEIIGADRAGETVTSANCKSRRQRGENG
jgi:hypothetical protein